MADFNEEFNELSPVRVMGRILRFIFTTNSAIWFEKDLTEELADYQAKLPVEIDLTSISETIEWLKSQKQSWVVHPQEIATALEYNHCWPSIRTSGKIIGCIKIGFRNVYIVDYNRVIELPERMAFIYDTYVLQEQRGKGVAKHLITQAIKFLKAQGYTKVRCHIPPWNKASISAYEKIGFKKFSYIRYFRIFGVSIRKANPAEEN
jgi:ribosomal protein S18 acetylase RimI-like enzyme